MSSSDLSLIGLCLLHGTGDWRESLRFWQVVVLRSGRTGERDRLLRGSVGRYAFARQTTTFQWSFQARTYFDTVNPRMDDHLHAVETNSERVILLSSLGDVTTEIARKMFYAMTILLQGPPWLLQNKVEVGNGFETWRLLVERHEGANAC